MEIGRINLNNIPMLSGQMGLEESEGGIFSRVLAEFLGLVDLDSPGQGDLAQLLELSPTDEEEEVLPFNPMELVWPMREELGNLAPHGLDTKSKGVEEGLRISGEPSLRLEGGLALDSQVKDMILGEAESFASEEVLDLARPDLDLEVPRLDLESDMPEDNPLKIKEARAEGETSLKRLNPEESPRDQDISPKSKTDFDLDRVQYQTTTTRLVFNEIYQGQDFQLTSVDGMDFDDNIQRISDAVLELKDLKVDVEENTLRVELYPEELGHVDISLKMEEGRLVARILVENEQILDLFNKNLNQLNGKLLRHHINLERLEVDLNLATANQSSPGRDQEAMKYPFTDKRASKLTNPLGALEIRKTYNDGAGGLNILA
jgi:hypothetical protein